MHDIKDEEAEVIIATTQISAQSPPSATLDHMMSGAVGQRVECIQGTLADLADMFSLAKARGKKYGPKLFVIAPGPRKGKPPLSPEFILSVVWPMVAATFNVPASEGVVFQHDPQRPEDAEHRHWHAACHHHDPVTGKSRPAWSWDRAKVERCSRVIEVLTDDKILVGRFQPLVIRTLREMGEHEFADAIERANPPDAQPAGRTPKRQVEQPAKLKGLNLREVERAVRAAYQASDTLPAFRAALADSGLSLVVSHRVPDRPAWTVHNADGFVRSLGGCLPRVSLTTITEKIGVPDARQLDIIDAIDAAGPGSGNPGVRESGGGDHHVHRQGAGMEGVAGAAPDGKNAGDRETFAGIFVRVLTTTFDAQAIEDLEKRAERIMISPLLRCIAFFRNVATKAKNFLQRVLPAPSAYLINSREVVDDMTAALEASKVKAAEQADKIKAMKLASAPPDVGRKAHQQRLANAERELAELNRAVRRDQDNLADAIGIADQFEKHHSAKVVAAQKAKETEIRVARQHIRVAARCDALLAEAPETAPLGAPALFYHGLRQDLAAKPDARWKVGTPPSDDPAHMPPVRKSL